MKIFCVAMIFCCTSALFGQETTSLPQVIAIQQSQIAKLQSQLDKLKAADGSILAANGTKVVDPNGKWVGSPSGLKGDKGNTGDQGERGPTGPQGSFSHCSVVSNQGRDADSVATECPANTRRTGGGCYILSGTFSSSGPVGGNEQSWQCIRTDPTKSVTMKAYAICCS